MAKVYYDKKENSGYMQLDYVDLHRLSDKGHFDPVSWFKQVEMCHVLIMFAIKNSDLSIAWPSTALFVLKQDLEFTPNMMAFTERFTLNTSNKYQMPLRVIHRTTKVNTSSMVCTGEIKDLLTDSSIVNDTIVTVLMDPVTRRPVSFPDGFRDFIEECSNRNSPPQYVKGLELAKSIPLDRPVFTLSRKVSMMETDFNGHTNNSSYAKLAYECLSHALSQECSVKLSNDLSHSFIKKCSIRYIKESKIGQVVDAVMWQSDDDSIHFILRSNKTDLAYLTILFYL